MEEYYKMFIFFSQNSIIHSKFCQSIQSIVDSTAHPLFKCILLHIFIFYYYYK